MVATTELRYSHAEGLTFAKYDTSGQYLLTAGADGDVRIYTSLSDDEVSSKVGQCVTALSVRDDEFVVATESNEVKTCSVPDGTQKDFLVRFTAKVNSICYSSDANLIAAGASDFLVKVVDKTDMSQKQMNGHKAPVLCVSFCPGDQLLASSSCDGTLKIWDVAKQECIKSLDIFPKCNDTSTSKILCIIDWCRGKTPVIVVPNEKGIKLISSENWSELCTLEGSHTELVSIVKCSPCGKFIASSSTNGEIAIWELSTRKQIEFIKHDTRITAIDWNPNGEKEILFADEMGRFSIFSDVVPVNDEGKDYNLADVSDKSDTVKAAPGRSHKRAYESDDSDEDDDEPPVGSAHKRHRVQNFENFLDDEADDDDDDIANISINLIKEGFLPQIEESQKDDEQGSLKDFIVEEKPKILAPTQNFQKPFQPGATPDHLMHRFMIWNSVGIIRCHSEDEISTIDIEFHDASLHHPLHFTNVMNHTMAALSPTAAALACRSLDGMNSKLVCLHFGTWDSTKEWTVSMTKGEEIMCVTANRRFVAAATNFGFIRIFTVGGLQYHILSIPGPVVVLSMCETQLMIVYHQATGKPPSQCLGMQLYEIGRLQWKLTVEQQLPIGFKSTLVWIGFSAEETPFTVDSKGIVRMFQRSFGCCWSPVLNLKAQTKTKSDNYWIVGITENPPEARAILCKAANFPATLPRPLPSALPFRIPLCDKDTEKSQLEDSLVRNRIFNQYHDYHKKKRLERDEIGLAQSKTTEIQLLMKLFALSCKSDRIFRAVEICELMPNADTVNLAIQYATKLRKMHLAQRLVELARKKAEEEEDEADEAHQSDDSNSIKGESDDEMQPTTLYQKPLSMRSSTTSFSYRHPNASSYDGRRGIGKPKGIPRIHRDSTGNVFHRPEMEDEGNEQTGEDYEDKGDGYDQFEYDDVDIDNGLEMESNSNDDASAVIQSLTAVEQDPVSSHQTRSNPFKLTPNTKAKSTSSSRGTSYFESLKSTLPPRNKPGSSTAHLERPTVGKKKTVKQNSKQSTLFCKQSMSDDFQSKDLKPKESQMKAKRVTGFLLFREHLSMKMVDQNNELVSKSLEEWKGLSADEKKTWNDKAAIENLRDESNQNAKEAKNLDLKSHASTNSVKAICEADESTQTTKSKLAAFAFKRT